MKDFNLTEILEKINLETEASIIKEAKEKQTALLNAEFGRKKEMSLTEFASVLNQHKNNEFDVVFGLCGGFLTIGFEGEGCFDDIALTGLTRDELVNWIDSHFLELDTEEKASQKHISNLKNKNLYT
jgi:hypothetical protein